MRQASRNSKVNLAFIKSYLKQDSFLVKDFHAVSGYQLEELIARKKTEQLAKIRQVSMVYYALSGFSVKGTSRIFQRNHATCHYAIQQVAEAIINPKHNKLVIDLLERIKNKHVTHYELSTDPNTQQMIVLDLVVKPLLDIDVLNEKVRNRMIINRINQFKIAG